MRLCWFLLYVLPTFHVLIYIHIVSLKFNRYELTATYSRHEIAFDFWCRSLWDWVLDLVGNPALAPYFEWDAQKVFKHDGSKFVRFFNEPWTADRSWEVQVSISNYISTSYSILLVAAPFS